MSRRGRGKRQPRLRRLITRDGVRRPVKSEAFENTFAPAVSHERLTVHEIMAGMRVGAIHPDSLPPDVP